MEHKEHNGYNGHNGNNGCRSWSKSLPTEPQNIKEVKVETWDLIMSLCPQDQQLIIRRLSLRMPLESYGLTLGFIFLLVNTFCHPFLPWETTLGIIDPSTGGP